MALAKTEAHVAAMLDKGYSPENIISSGVAECVVKRVANWSSTAGDTQREAAIRSGSDQLRDAILAQSREFSARRAAARKLSATVHDPLPLRRPSPVRTFSPPSMTADRRPVAAGRDPCTRCQTRGDLGCEHQQPCDQALPEPVAKAVADRNRQEERQTSHDGGRRFTAKEDLLLETLLRAGHGPAEIGRQLGLDCTSIHSRIRVLSGRPNRTKD